MPRRRVLVIGPAIMSGLLAIFVGLNSMISGKLGADGKGPIPNDLARGALAVYMLFGCVIAFVYTPLQSLLPVEALSNSMRAKGLTIYTFTMGAMGFINMFAGPIGLYSIGYKYIIVFVVVDALEVVVWYFCCVEAVGRTLEELDYGEYRDVLPMVQILTIDQFTLSPTLLEPRWSRTKTLPRGGSSNKNNNNNTHLLSRVVLWKGIRTCQVLASTQSPYTGALNQKRGNEEKRV